MRAVALIVVVLILVTVRVLVESHSELTRAEAFERKGHIDGAIVHYRRAAAWYFPMSPFAGQAIGKLALHARRLEREADLPRALSAWRAIRASIMSARSFYTPFPEELATANTHIANLMALQDPPPIDATKSTSAIRRGYLDQLERTHRPSSIFSVMVLAGFAAFVTGMFGFALCAIDTEDRLVSTRARRWTAITVVGFAVFVLGMVLA